LTREATAVSPPNSPHIRSGLFDHFQLLCWLIFIAGAMSSPRSGCFPPPRMSPFTHLFFSSTFVPFIPFGPSTRVRNLGSNPAFFDPFFEILLTFKILRVFFFLSGFLITVLQGTYNRSPIPTLFLSSFFSFRQ